jgi:hypothetical protein
MAQAAKGTPDFAGFGSDVAFVLVERGRQRVQMRWVTPCHHDYDYILSLQFHMRKTMYPAAFDALLLCNFHARGIHVDADVDVHPGGRRGGSGSGSSGSFCPAAAAGTMLDML